MSPALVARSPLSLVRVGWMDEWMVNMDGNGGMVGWWQWDDEMLAGSWGRLVGCEPASCGVEDKLR